MTIPLDHQVADALTAMAAEQPPAPPLRVGDWQAIRHGVAASFGALGARVPAHPEVTRTVRTTTSADGTEIDLHWFTPPRHQSDHQPGYRPGPAILYAHGGGRVAANVDLEAPWITADVAASGVPVLAMDYRLAPEAPGTAPAEDVFAALAWLIEHAPELGVDLDRVAVMGASAGGGLAAGAVLLAHQRGVPVARQILIYPMLDDRTTTPDPQLEGVATWTYDMNATGWGAVLGAARGGPDVDPVAAPARLEDAAGLPPAWIEVGEVDIFRDEDVAYARTLWAAGVSVELHVRPGAVHGFHYYAPDSDVTRHSLTERWTVMRSL